MLERPGNLSAQASAHIAILGAAVSMLMIAAGAPWPQTPSPAPSLGIQEPAQNTVPQPAPSPSPPEPEGNPGLFNEIGRMFDKLPTLKATQETIEDLNARAKGAARDASESLSHLAKPSSMVSGRMMCPVSTNGAPDCKLGADKLCQAKGYKEGKSLNTDSAETCSARVLIPGRTRKSGDCRTDNFVTSALCQ
ncbi:MAG: hypothetical protein JWP51_4498 [Bradyrhizobium sp.]|nr:hypothetical protein [Bradyrhizobium sp.]